MHYRSRSCAHRFPPMHRTWPLTSCHLPNTVCGSKYNFIASFGTQSRRPASTKFPIKATESQWRNFHFPYATKNQHWAAQSSDAVCSSIEMALPLLPHSCRDHNNTNLPTTFSSFATGTFYSAVEDRMEQLFEKGSSLCSYSPTSWSSTSCFFMTHLLTSSHGISEPSTA